MAATVDVLLRKIDEGVAEVRAHYEADLAAKTLSDEILYAIRNVIQDCQSALDWTATAVKKKFYAAGKWSPYFPLAKQPTDFPQELERQIKGLLADHPDVAAAFERHQPYRPGKTELGHLHALSRVNKHQDFTAQERQTRRQITVEGPTSSLSMFMANEPGGEGVTIHPDAEVTMGGVRVDPTTLMPLDGGPKPYNETIYVDWCFVDPPVSVIGTLEALAGQVRAAVEDIRSEAKL